MVALGERVLVGFVDSNPARPVVLAHEDAEGSGWQPSQRQSTPAPFPLGPSASSVGIAGGADFLVLGTPYEAVLSGLLAQVNALAGIAPSGPGATNPLVQSTAATLAGIIDPLVALSTTVKTKAS